MNNWALFGTVALAHLLAVMSPGPDFAMVTRQTLAHGRAAGVWTALGIGAGITVHMAWGMFGLAWIIEKFPPFLEVLRYAGALFLLVMGAQALRSQPAHPGADATRAQAGGWKKNFGIGVATNVLNPKAVMFFTALCAAVITGATPVALRLALSLWIILATATWFSLVAFTLGHPRLRARLQDSAHWIDRGMGAILLLLGMGMLLAGLHP